MLALCNCQSLGVVAISCGKNNIYVTNKNKLCWLNMTQTADMKLHAEHHILLVLFIISSHQILKNYCCHIDNINSAARTQWTHF